MAGLEQPRAGHPSGALVISRGRRPWIRGSSPRITKPKAARSYLGADSARSDVRSDTGFADSQAIGRRLSRRMGFSGVSLVRGSAISVAGIERRDAERSGTTSARAEGRFRCKADVQKVKKGRYITAPR